MWVIVPIFWSSTFTCPIFAIEEICIFMTFFGTFLSPPYYSTENGMSRKSSTRIWENDTQFNFCQLSCKTWSFCIILLCTYVICTFTWKLGKECSCNSDSKIGSKRIIFSKDSIIFSNLNLKFHKWLGVLVDSKAQTNLTELWNVGQNSIGHPK